MDVFMVMKEIIRPCYYALQMAIGEWVPQMQLMIGLELQHRVLFQINLVVLEVDIVA